MSISLEPHFEVRLRADQDSWEIMVTWGHALGHVVEGLAFRSEHTALRWIEQQSSLWMEVQNRGPAKTSSSEDLPPRGDTAKSSRSISSPRIFHRTCALFPEKWNLATLTDCYMP